MARDYIVKTKNLCVGDIAADSDALLYPVWKVENAIKITAVRLGSKASVAAADTNYNTFYLKALTVVIGTFANGPVAGGKSFVLGTLVDADLATAAGANEVASGATLSLKVTKTGSGLAVTGLHIQIDYMDMNP
jgi:hypothetical protein